MSEKKFLINVNPVLESIYSKGNKALALYLVNSNSIFGTTYGPEPFQE